MASARALYFLNSDYAAVGEQSGIRAGDGGFQIDVKGNTDLKGGVIASSDKAVLDGLNNLTTATLTHSNIQNEAHYSGSQIGISGGYSFGGGGDTDKSGIGKDQRGKADNVNPVPGTELPSSRSGFTAAPPIVLSASGDASSTTSSAISGGTITITDSAKQQQLTGKTAAETVAGINRDASNTGGALAPIFDKDKVQAGFEIAGQFVNQAGTFVGQRIQEADAKRQTADKLEKQAADPSSNLTDGQRQQLWEQAQQTRAEAVDTESKWGAGGTYRQIANALTAAAGGNVSGSYAQFMQSAVVNYVQQQGAGYIGKLVADGVVKEGSPEHASLHAIVACAGAAASSQSCGAGALGAAASSLLTNLFTDDAKETNADKDAKRNLVTSLVAGVAAVVSSSNAATATTAATAAVDNNWLTPKQKIERDQKLANCTTDACRKEVRDQFAKLWQSNHDRAENCSTVQSCLAVVNELRGVQQESGERTNELWAAAGSVDTDLSFSSLLKLYRTDVAERRMPARRIVEALDVVEHV